MIKFLKKMIPVSRYKYETKKIIYLSYIDFLRDCINRRSKKISELEFESVEKDLEIDRLKIELAWAKDMLEYRDKLSNEFNRNNRLERMCR